MSDISLSSSINLPVTRPHYVISVDIEADGDAPTVSSCIEIGIVVADADTKQVVDRRNWMMLAPAGHFPTERCISEFWNKTPENTAHLHEIRKDGLSPLIAMEGMAAWWKALKEQARCCSWFARPSSYDWQWVNGWYVKFGPENKIPLPHSVDCLSTQIRDLERLGIAKTELHRRFTELPTTMTHKAVDDAEHQLGMYFVVQEYFTILATLTKAALAK